jgi:uncharacterized protein YlaN (UPF0358 family)
VIFLLNDFFSQALDTVRHNTIDFRKDVKIFLMQLDAFFTQPKFNCELSTQTFQIDRFINYNIFAVLVDETNGKVYNVLTRDLPPQATDFDNIKIKNGDYVVDNSDK